jgi:SAM-dependent methyltransferase
MQKEVHQDRLKKEIDWHEQQSSHHTLNRWPFQTVERNAANFAIAKTHLFATARKRHPILSPESVLLAPAGHFDDLRYVRSTWPNVSIEGVDIADSGLREHPEIPSVVADISQRLPYPDGYFGAVVSTLFFHHVIDEGFDAYLHELRRVLSPGGLFITMEHSWLNPAFWITRPLKRLVGNITHQVEHERPIFPWRLFQALERCHFQNVETFACSFGHNRMPIPLANLTNSLFRPLRPLRYFSWQVGFLAS